MTTAPTLVHSPHPILAAADRRVVNAPLRPGESLLHYLEREGVNAALPHAVTINGTVIPCEQWGVHLPVPGDMINVRALMQGGGGSDAKRTILLIAVAVAAAWTGGAAAGMYTAGSGASLAAGAAAGAAVQIAGTYLVNELAPMRQNNLSDGEGSSPSATYSIANGRNRMRPGEPCLLVVGRHRVKPDLASLPYSDYRDGEQRLHQLFDFGLGNLSLSDFKIGETPIEEFNSAASGSVDLEIDDSGLRNLGWGNVDTEQVGSITAADDNHVEVIRTTSEDTVQIGVDLSVQSYVVYRGAVLAHLCEVEVQYRAVGDSTWLSMVTGFDSVLFDGYWSYGDYVTDNSGPDGAPDVWVQTEYEGGEQGSAPGPTSGSGSYWRWIDGASAAHPGWRWPHPYIYVFNTVDYAVINDPVTNQPDPASPKRFSYAHRVPAGQYEVRLFQRTSKHPTLDGGQDVYWSALKSFRADGGDYHGRTRGALTLVASGQVNGVVDELSALAEQWIPVRLTDGSWTTQPSTNPAWQFLWLARGKRINDNSRDDDGQRTFGAGFADSQIDLATIYDWAAFCDDHSLSCSLVFDQAQSIGEMLTIIAQCGRAGPTWGTGKLGVVWDEANAPITQVFNPANIKPGSFRVDYIGGRLPPEIIGIYQDADAGTRREVRVAVTGGDTSGDPVRQELLGVDNEDQARRECNLIAASQRFRRRRISWETDVEGLQCSRGDVLSVAHDVIGWGQGRRIASGDRNDLVLTGDVEFGTGTHYVTVRHGNGDIDTRQVSSESSGTITDTIGLTSNLSRDPDINCVVTFGADSEPGKRVKLVDYKPKGENAIRLVAVDEAPEYYAAETNPAIAGPPTDYIKPVPAVADIRISEELITAGGITEVIIAPTLLHCERWSLQLRWSSDEPWRDYGTHSEATYRKGAATGTALHIRVTPVALAQMRQGAAVELVHTVVGLLAPPPLPTGLSVIDINGELRAWAVSSEYDPPDLAGYKLRYHATEIIWDNMTPVHEGVVPAVSQHVEPVLSGTYNLAAVAVDQGGRESTPLIISATFSMTGLAGGSVFIDDFSNPATVERWVNHLGGAERAIITSADSITGGGVMQVGNDTGDDMAWMIRDQRIPFDPNRIYRVRCRLRQVSGVGVAYMGFAGYDASGNLLSTTGTNTFASQHYAGMVSASLGAQMAEHTGYLAGYGVTQGAYGPGDQPAKAHPNVRYIAPMLILNYNAEPGLVEVDHFTVDYVAGTDDIAEGAASQTFAWDSAAAVRSVFTDIQWGFSETFGPVQAESRKANAVAIIEWYATIEITSGGGTSGSQIYGALLPAVKVADGSTDMLETIPASGTSRRLRGWRLETITTPGAVDYSVTVSGFNNGAGYNANIRDVKITVQVIDL